jgi:hypothetical protein
MPPAPRRQAHVCLRTARRTGGADFLNSCSNKEENAE